MAGLTIKLGVDVTIQQMPQEYVAPEVPTALNPDSTQMYNPDSSVAVNPGG